MAETKLLYLTDASRELEEAIDRDGPLQLLNNPPIYLVRPPQLDIPEQNGILFPDNVRALNESMTLALSSTRDQASPHSPENIQHHLEIAAAALQLVRPTPDFLEYWLTVDSDRGITLASSSIRSLPSHGAYSYLEYQQLHTLTIDDVRRATAYLPNLVLAMGPDPNGSWGHAYGSVHRALIFFCQGYTAGLPAIPQLFWAAGLDSLFASKLDRARQGAREISRRMQLFFGSPNFDPYTADTVTVPGHQQRPPLRLADIAPHIFWLRNAYIHGGPIPAPAWLGPPAGPPEAGYAYQLAECSEILLRVSLLRILENQALLNTFRDPAALDAHF